MNSHPPAAATFWKGCFGGIETKPNQKILKLQGVFCMIAVPSGGAIKYPYNHIIT